MESASLAPCLSRGRARSADGSPAPRRSPGYAITLLASSTSHVLHSAEATSCPPPPSASSSTAEPAHPPVPEDLGIAAARLLLDEVRRGGCVDRGWEWLVTTMLVLGGEDVGRVVVAGPFEAFLCVPPPRLPLSLSSSAPRLTRAHAAHRIEHLRDLKAFFGTTFKVKDAVRTAAAAGASEAADDEDEDAAMASASRAPPPEEYVLSCVGTGFVNTAKRAG